MNLMKWEEDEMIELIFTPDVINNYQFEAVNHRRSMFSPELALKAAILEQAIQDFLGLGSWKGRAKKQDDVVEYINNNDYGFNTFNEICESLGINPLYLRKLLWQEKNSNVKRKRYRVRVQSRRHCRHENH